jgi:hypothetical protein
MDFYAETEKRKQKFLGQIGELSYRRYMLLNEVEEIDQAIVALEARLREADQAQRNFNTYLAVKEGALTTDELAQAIQDGNKEKPK